jgi:predicted amidophosphoribosyltransferase
MRTWLRIEKKEYAICPECGRKVTKEYPRPIHAKCLVLWEKRETA